MKIICDICQQAISTSIDFDDDSLSEVKNHIEECAECAEFYRLWGTPDADLKNLASKQLLSISRPDLRAKVMEEIYLIEASDRVPSPSAAMIRRKRMITLKPWLAVAAVITLASIFWLLDESTQSNKQDLASSDGNQPSSGDQSDILQQKPELVQLAPNFKKQHITLAYGRVSNLGSAVWKKGMNNVSAINRHLNSAQKRIHSHTKDQDEATEGK